MVTYIEDKDLIFHVKEYDVVLVGTTINNSLGNGFQKEVERSFRYVSDANKQTPYGIKEKYGTILVVEGEPTFCLCYIYGTRSNPNTKPDVLNYDALMKCLSRVNERFKGKKIATTLIGTSEFDGGGDPSVVKEMLEETLNDVDAYIYLYKQQNVREADADKFDEIVRKRTDWKITREEYEQLKKEYIWVRYMGYYNEMPDMSYPELKQYIKSQLKNERNEYEEGAS